MKEEMQGRGFGAGPRVRALTARRPARPTSSGSPSATTGRRSTAAQAMVVYGHTPVPEPEWLNRTINIDTGCVFGGRLTALRYPETRAGVGSRRADLLRTAEAARRRGAGRSSARPRTATCSTSRTCWASGSSRPASRQRHHPRGERGAALEVMSRFAVDPRWLIYLPPTMSPSETSKRSRTCWSIRPRPSRYYRDQGVDAGRLRREAHGLAGGRRRLPRRGRGSDADSASADGDSASATPARGVAFFDDGSARSRSARPRPNGDQRRPAAGRSSRQTGSASTAS